MPTEPVEEETNIRKSVPADGVRRILQQQHVRRYTHSKWCLRFRGTAYLHVKKVTKLALPGTTV